MRASEKELLNIGLLSIILSILVNYFSVEFVGRNLLVCSVCLNCVFYRGFNS